MEGRVWVTVLRFLPLDQCASGRFAFSDRVILMVMLWAVLHDRPMAWACQSDHWPDWARPRRLPHASTISRRSRTSTVTAEMERVYQRSVEILDDGETYAAIDGRPLLVGGASKDADARPGRAVGGMGRGYKLHAVVDAKHVTVAFAVHPLNEAEQAVAKELMPVIPRRFRRIVGDTLYDSMPLHRAAELNGRRVYTRLRQDRVGRRQQPRRLQLLRLGKRTVGQRLLHWRDEIERAFGQATALSFGFKGLPAWARRIHRVRRWMWGKIVLHHCWLIQKTTAA